MRQLNRATKSISHRRGELAERPYVCMKRGESRQHKRNHARALRRLARLLEVSA